MIPRPTIVNLILVVLSLPAGPSVAQDPFQGIEIRSENRCSSYDPADYHYPQSVESKIARRQGGQFSPYSMRCFKSLRSTDIEHIVARSEAHDSGLCAAPGYIKRAFASDLLNLTLAAPRLNREQKVAKDAADWLPEHNRCWYAHTILAVKRKYSLSVDKKEHRSLRRVLRKCDSVQMEIPKCVRN